MILAEPNFISHIIPFIFMQLTTCRNTNLSSILLPCCRPPWTDTLPRHFCRGQASHKPFDFLPSIYPFYMFYAAKTFSVHRRVHNHFTKRILNLILNRKKFLRRGNEALDKQKPRQNRRGWLAAQGYGSPTVITFRGWPDERS